MLFDVPRPAARIRAGVAHVPGFLDVSAQAELVSQARDLARRGRMDRPGVGSGQMSVFILSVGREWRTRPYRYVPSELALPEQWIALGRSALATAARVAPELADDLFRPEAALVNYYPPGSSMGLHVDANEESSAPVVSLSIGDEALFRIGHTEGRTRPWDDVTLMSGDLIVFGGPARRAYHGVPAVRPGTAPVGCGIKEGRLNITLRQVDRGGGAANADVHTRREQGKCTELNIVQSSSCRPGTSGPSQQSNSGDIIHDHRRG